MQWTLYSRYLSIADIIFRSQFTLPPITDLSIADAPNNRPYKTFLVRNLYAFYFRQFFTVSLKFSSIFVFLFFSQFNNLFRFITIKTRGDFTMVDAFPSCKNIQSGMGKGQKHEYNHGDFCCTWPITSYIQLRLVQTIATAFLSISLVGSSMYCKYSPTSGFQVII